LNPFALLGVDETADDAAVRAAYLAGVRRFPPDRDPDAFQRIRDAYQAIRDEEHRLDFRLFGPPPLERLEELLATFPGERRHVGPRPWLDALRRDRA